MNGLTAWKRLWPMVVVWLLIIVSRTSKWKVSELLMHIQYVVFARMGCH
jgi:hypothetical protein